jgi:hypothetical protein
VVSDTIVTCSLDLIDLGEPKSIGLAEFLNLYLLSFFDGIFLKNYLLKNKWIVVILFTINCIIHGTKEVKIGYLKYNGWSLIVSMVVYLLAFGFLIPVLL